jgi:hypothetical protein
MSTYEEECDVASCGVRSCFCDDEPDDAHCQWDSDVVETLACLVGMARTNECNDTENLIEQECLRTG